MLGRGLLGLPRQPLRALRGAAADAAARSTDVPGVERDARRARRSRARLARAARAGRRAAATAACSSAAPRRAPRPASTAAISPHRRFAFGSLSLDRVKALKNELGHHGQRRRRGAVRERAARVAARARRAARRAARRDGPRVRAHATSSGGRSATAISTMFVPIPTDVADPRERLMRAHEMLRSAKERHARAARRPAHRRHARSSRRRVARARRAHDASRSCGRARPPLNLVISNVPGPRDPLYLRGRAAARRTTRCRWSSTASG